MDIIKFLRTCILQENLRETVSAFLFKLFSIDLSIFFSDLILIFSGTFSYLAQRNAFLFAPNQPPEVFCKKSFLKNFAMFRGKNQCYSLFLIKLQAWRPVTLIKRDSNTVVFLTAIFLRTPIWKNVCKQLLLFADF